MAQSLTWDDAFEATVLIRFTLGADIDRSLCPNVLGVFGVICRVRSGWVCDSPPPTANSLQQRNNTLTINVVKSKCETGTTNSYLYK